MTTPGAQKIANIYRQPLVLPVPPKLASKQTIIQRLKSHDALAIKDCLDTYGGKIWALTKKFTRSHQEAELVTEAVFRDIWIYAATGHDDDGEPVEDRIITQIALRRLIKYQWEGRDIL